MGSQSQLDHIFAVLSIHHGIFLGFCAKIGSIFFCLVDSMQPTGGFTKQSQIFWVELGSQPQLDHMFAGLEHTPQDFSWVLPPRYRSRINQFFSRGFTKSWYVSALGF